jgi:hypothetical protein
MSNESTTDTPPTYDTYDIGIAAMLFVTGIKLAGIGVEDKTSKYPRGRAVFQFAEETRCTTTVQDYLCGNLRVDPQALINKLNEYRRIIYNKEALRAR